MDLKGLKILKIYFLVMIFVTGACITDYIPRLRQPVQR